MYLTDFSLGMLALEAPNAFDSHMIFSILQRDIPTRNSIIRIQTLSDVQLSFELVPCVSLCAVHENIVLGGYDALILPVRSRTNTQSLLLLSAPN
jgi:hypothetical protein